MIRNFPTVTADASSIIKWSLKSHRPTAFFTSRVGLPQTKKNKHVGGHATIEGELAAICKSLYHKTFEIASEVIEPFTCKEDVRANAVIRYRGLSKRFIEETVQEFEPVLWNPSDEQRSTKVDRHHFPHCLEYSNGSDLERITLYLHCWVLNHAMEKLPLRNHAMEKLPSKNHAMEKLPPSPPEIDDRSSDDEPLVPPSPAPHCTRAIDEDPVTDNEDTMRIHDRKASLASQAVPVAPMFGTQPTCQPRVHGDGNETVFKSSVEEKPGSDGDNNDDISIHDDPRLINNTRSRIKRKNDSVTTHPGHQPKHHKDLHDAAIGEISSPRRRSNSRYTPASQEDIGTTVHPSSSAVEGRTSHIAPHLTVASRKQGSSVDQNFTGVDNGPDGMARRGSGHRGNPSRKADVTGAGLATMHEVGGNTAGAEDDSGEALPDRPSTTTKSMESNPSSQPRHPSSSP